MLNDLWDEALAAALNQGNLLENVGPKLVDLVSMQTPRHDQTGALLVVQHPHIMCPSWWDELACEHLHNHSAYVFSPVGLAHAPDYLICLLVE